MWQFINSATQAAGSAPMFTWRNGHSRVELSGKTFLNAVSKAANFIVDGLEVDEVQPVYVSLGNHWQSPVWNAAVLAAGAVLSDEPSQFNIVMNADIDLLSGTIAVVSKDPFGMPEKDLPASVINASAEVRGFGDYFAPRSVTTGDTALTTWGVKVDSAQQLVADLASSHSVAPREAIGLALADDLRFMVNWQCFFSTFNQSPIVLLDGQFDRSIVESQERITQFIAHA